MRGRVATDSRQALRGHGRGIASRDAGDASGRVAGRLPEVLRGRPHVGPPESRQPTHGGEWHSNACSVENKECIGLQARHSAPAPSCVVVPGIGGGKPASASGSELPAVRGGRGRSMSPAAPRGRAAGPGQRGQHLMQQARAAQKRNHDMMTAEPLLRHAEAPNTAHMVMMAAWILVP